MGDSVPVSKQQLELTREVLFKMAGDIIVLAGSEGYTSDIILKMYFDGEDVLTHLKETLQ